MREYKRGVMFVFGRFSHVCGSSLIFMISAIRQMVRVDFGTVVMEVPTELDLMRNVSLKSMPVRYLHVVDPEKAVVTVEQFATRRRWAAVTLPSTNAGAITFVGSQRNG